MNRPPAPGRPAPPASSAPRVRPPAMPQRTAPPRPPERQAPPEQAPPAAEDRRAIREAVRRRRRALASELRRPAPRRRRLVPLVVAAVLALLVGLPLLLAFAPVFTVQRIEVPGATTAVAEQVRAALAGERGRPIALVPEDRVGAALRTVRAVESFALVRRPPSTLEVRVVLRTAVAQQRAGTEWQQVDAARVVVASGTVQDPDLPVVTVTGEKPERAFAAAVAAIEAVQRRGLRIGGVRADGADDVVLTLPGGRRVQWGGAEASAQKAEALAAALVRAGRKVEEIDVSSPGVVLTR